jgi:hypothetical protein
MFVGKVGFATLGLIATHIITAGSATGSPAQDRQSVLGGPASRAKPAPPTANAADLVARLSRHEASKARMAAPLPVGPVAKVSSKKCRLGCVKKAVRSLIRAYSDLARSHNRLVRNHNSLVGKHNGLVNATATLASDFDSLANDYYNCELLVDVTQYDGYVYDGAVLTTALDFTTPGDLVDESLVTYVC